METTSLAPRSGTLASPGIITDQKTICSRCSVTDYQVLNSALNIPKENLSNEPFAPCIAELETDTEEESNLIDQEEIFDSNYESNTTNSSATELVVFSE